MAVFFLSELPDKRKAPDMLRGNSMRSFWGRGDRRR